MPLREPGQAEIYQSCSLTIFELRLACILVLQARWDEFLALFGICCSTYVSISRGSTKRSTFLPMGCPISLANYRANKGTARFGNEITLLRVIPTMTFIHFLTGKSSGILSDISSDILFGILSGICSGTSSGILSGKSSGILSGISSGILSGKSPGILSGIFCGILSDILSGILFGIPSGILSGISSGILSGISSGILSGISSGILSGISHGILSVISSDILSGICSDILSGICSDILSGISSDILSDILSGILSGISSDILSLTFFPLRSGSAHCDLEVAVEVRQCPLRSGSRGWGPAVPTATWKSRLKSDSAHWDLELAVEVRQCPLGSGARGGGPAVPTGMCPLGSGARGGGPAVPTGIWTARRRTRRRWRRRRRRRRTALIKSNNPHLAGGEKKTFKISKQIHWNHSQYPGWLVLLSDSLVYPQNAEETSYPTSSIHSPLQNASSLISEFTISIWTYLEMGVPPNRWFISWKIRSKWLISG